MRTVAMQYIDNVKFDNEMKYTDYSKEAELIRLEGEECLSWIERFGIYLLERNIYEGEPEKCENILVIRMKEDIVSAYYCYFYTNHESKTQFTIHTYQEKMDNKLLSEMLNDNRWDSNETRLWWSEVFADGNLDLVDYTLLKNEMIRVSTDASMNMAEYIESITERIESSLEKLWKGKNYTVSGIFLAGDYAGVLPLQYSLMMKFGCVANKFNADQTIGFYDSNLKLNDVSKWFYIPWKFRNMQLSISPAMTLEQVAATNGISIPLPVIVADKNTKEIVSVHLTDKPISGYDNLCWQDLIVNDNYADLQLDEYFFKDMMLSIIPDGYGTYYIGNVKDKKRRIMLNYI